MQQRYQRESSRRPRRRPQHTEPAARRWPRAWRAPEANSSAARPVTPGALEFLNAVERLGNLTVRRVDEDIDTEAWRWLRRRHERQYSYVDATSFAGMRKLRLRHALAFDGDFASAGLVEVRPTD